MRGREREGTASRRGSRSTRSVRLLNAKRGLMRDETDQIGDVQKGEIEKLRTRFDTVIGPRRRHAAVSAISRRLCTGVPCGQTIHEYKRTSSQPGFAVSVSG